MNQIIVHSSALLSIDIVNLKQFNREHKPITVTVVSDNGYSHRYRITETEVNLLSITIPTLPTGRLIVL